MPTNDVAATTKKIARLLRVTGDAPAAVRLCRDYIRQNPTRSPPVEILRLFALSLQAAQDPCAGAIEQRRVVRRTDRPDDWYLLGAMEMAAGNVDRATGAWTTAINAPGGHDLARRHLIMALIHHRHFDQALPYIHEGRRLHAEEGFYARHLADHLARLGQLSQARLEYQSALTLDENDALAWYHLGLVERDLGCLAAATTAFARTLALDADQADAHVDLGQMLLLQAQFDEGLAHWEWRVSNLYHGRPCPLPDLSRFEAAGKTTLTITCEQGYGDALQFCRYIPLLHLRGVSVDLRCRPALADLFSRLPGVARLTTRVPATVAPPAIGLLSLPHIFGTTLETVPALVPYLPVPDHPAAQMIQPDRRCSVGLVWTGNPLHANNHNRSCPLTALLPIIHHRNVRAYSLQPGAGANVKLPTEITDLGPALTDFSATAAVIARLDLVIAVDTAVAHLAGALGRPVWLLLPWLPDWRWLLNRSDSPWYPTMTLFRQPTPGDWAGCVAQVIERLG